MPSSQRLMLVGALLALAVALYLFFRPPAAEPGAANEDAGTAAHAARVSAAKAATPGAPSVPDARAPVATGSAHASANPASSVDVSAEAPSPIADALGASGASIDQDLRLLQEVLMAWHTNFPRTGFPEGDNAEITAALTGRNALRFQFIRSGHPAINARGELCDRWGTPFFFHALASDRMELRSAGPDRQMYTEDDALLAPP